MTPAKLFGKALRRCRKASGLSQAELAGALGYCKSYIGHFEHGRRLPSKELVARLDEHLGSGRMLTDLRKQLIIASVVMAGPAADDQSSKSDLNDPEINQVLDALTEALARLARLREEPERPDENSATQIR
jgi:transcriptional regulator with XRE-family HTH domain